MKQAVFTKNSVNVSVLDENLRNTVGADYLGLSICLGDVIVFLADSTSDELVEKVNSIVHLHDASALSTEQTAAFARQEALETVRNGHLLPLDLSHFTNSAQEVQILAGYLAWLELEVRALRGL